jgi:hypothetical protein
VEERRNTMSEKKYKVRAECPHCACGTISHIDPEKLKEKFIGDEKEIDVLCPLCATEHKGTVEKD